MYVSDENAVRVAIAEHRAEIERERANTIDRVERLRRFVRGDDLDYREREEWRCFIERTRGLQRDVDVMVGLLTKQKALRAPAPVIITT